MSGLPPHFQLAFSDVQACSLGKEKKAIRENPLRSLPNLAVTGGNAIISTDLSSARVSPIILAEGKWP